MEKFKVKAQDGYELDVHLFDVEKPKAVVQIVHGMEEHQERYEELAKILNDNGFAVVSSDMRGHGYNAKDLGYFKDKKGYVELISDQKAITAFIKERFENEKIYIFAHSMGTIITRVLLESSSLNYDKVILSGYPCYQSGAKIGIIISNIIKVFRGPKYKSKMLQNMSVGAFNKKIKNAKTNVDWVCANKKSVQKYIDDPYCGFGFTCSAFNDLYHLVILMHNPKNYKNVNKNLKLLLIRGKDDPCVGGDKGANNSLRVLEKAGFENIEKIDYEGMRHEIINELDNDKVFDDVVNFFNK